MRKLLLGTANNITENINKVKLWHNSFKKVCDGDVMLIVPGLTDEDIKLLGNIPHTGVKPPEGETVNNDRLIHQEQYLKLHLNNYDVVLVTDVFDVAFLKDPFTKMDFNNYNIFSYIIYSYTQINFKKCCFLAMRSLLLVYTQ